MKRQQLHKNEILVSAIAISKDTTGLEIGIYKHTLIVGQADSQQAKSMFRTHSVEEYDPAQAKLTQQPAIGNRKTKAWNKVDLYHIPPPAWE